MSSLREDLAAQTIVNHQPQWTEVERWEVAPEPTAVLYEAMEPVDAVMLRDRIIVLDRMLPGLLIYDSAGSLLTKVGREGRGPGEFLRPDRVFPYRGDSLGTYDAGTMRIDIRSVEGSYGRSVYVRPGVSRISFVGSFPDGSFTVRADGFSPKGRRWRDSVEVIHVDADGRQSESVALMPGWEFYSTEFQGRPTFGVRPFGRKTALAAAGSTVAVHLQDDCNLILLGRDGRVVRTVKSPCVRKRVTAALIRQFRAAQTAAQASEEARERAVWFYRPRHVPFPDRVPTYDRLVYDVTGVLWAEEFPLPGDSITEWRVFSQSGHWLGKVSIERSLAVAWIDRDRVVAIAADQIGRKWVEIHRLRRGEL